jgi:FkbH-like protein
VKVMNLESETGSEILEPSKGEIPAGTPHFSIQFAGNLTTQPFNRLSRADDVPACITITHADFGQVTQTLMSPSDVDVLILHLDHHWFFDLVPDDKALVRVNELQRLCSAWLDANRGSIFLNTVPFLPRSPVSSERHRQVQLIGELNAALFAFERREPRISVLDLSSVLAEVGYEAGVRERNRHVMRFPYTPAATAKIVSRYSEMLRNMLRPRRKAIILDADNTLWRGIVGEAGYEGIGVDDEFPNVIHKRFQQQIVELKRLGYIICIVTKNNESDFLEVFSKRRMPLSLDDVTSYRSNWLDKSENILSISNELNIDASSFVFIDDNPFEIEEVSLKLPSVECHLFPKDDPEIAFEFVNNIKSLTARATISEDLNKTEQYRAEAKRKEAAEAISSIEDYLKSLRISLTANLNQRTNLPRIAQLTNKTNQFNLTTKRYTESDIHNLMNSQKVFDFSIEDKFGDMGVVGVVIVVNGIIDTFLMSCRALGRRIEAEMLRLVTEDAATPLEATYVRSDRNMMTANFYEEHGFRLTEESENLKRYLQEKIVEQSEHVSVVKTF